MNKSECNDEIKCNDGIKCPTQLPKKSLQVAEQMQTLDSVLDSIHTHVIALQSRLYSVSRPSPPDENKEGPCCIAEEIVPLADELRFFYNRIAAMDEAVIDILGRLEI